MLARTRRLRRIFSLAILVSLGVVGQGMAQTKPKAFEPSIAVARAGSTFLALSVTGTNFGAAVAGSFVVFSGQVGGQTLTFTIPATDASVFKWRDEHVVVKAQPNLTHVSMKVRTAAGESAWAAADHYQFDSFDTVAAITEHIGPGHIAIDAGGRVWINGEFHGGVGYFDPATQTVRPAYWPRIPVPAFKTCVYACVPTTLSGGGEDATADSKGRIWFPEGGGGGIGPRNHSRIIGYDPTNHKVFLYNLPGDQNSLVGIAWDAARNRLWFSQGQIDGGRPAMLTSFDPDNPAIPREEFDWDFQTLPACNAGTCSDNPARTCSTFRDCMISSFDFTTTATCTAGGTCSNAPYWQCTNVEDCVLADAICAPGANDAACYHNYPIGGSAPAHIVVSPFDGTVWVANYDFAGNKITRLVPTTGGLYVYPLSLAPFTTPQLPVNSLTDLIVAVVRFGNWPWDIKLATNGDILVGEYGLTRIARLPRANLSRPDCFALVPPSGSSGSCEVGPIGPDYPQVIQMPVPGCANPCLTSTVVAASWEPSSAWPGFTRERVAGDMKTLAIDADNNIWFKHGYFEKGTRDMIRFPPLLGLYPTTYTQADPPNLQDSIADGMAINKSTGEVFGFDWGNRRLNRLRKLP